LPGIAAVRRGCLRDERVDRQRGCHGDAECSENQLSSAGNETSPGQDLTVGAQQFCRPLVKDTRDRDTDRYRFYFGLLRFIREVLIDHD
jgi:hypothetical protein